MRRRLPALLVLLAVLGASPPGAPASAAEAAAATSYVLWDPWSSSGVRHVNAAGALIATEGGGVRGAYDPALLLEPAPDTRLIAGRVALEPGRAPGQPVVSMGSAACTSTSSSLISGHLDVHDVAYDDAGRLVSLAADVSLDCGNSAPTVQLRLSSDLPVASLASSVTAGRAYDGVVAAASVTFLNDGTGPLSPAASDVRPSSGGDEDARVVQDGCAGSVLQPGEACTVRVTALAPGADVLLSVPELEGLVAGADRSRAAVRALVPVYREQRPGPVTDLQAVPAAGGVRLTWSSDPRVGPVSAYVVDRRSGTQDWLRLPHSSSSTYYADPGAPAGVASSYRVTPVGGAGEDPVGAALSSPVSPGVWALATDAVTYASVDGGPLMSGQDITVTSSGVQLRLAEAGTPLVYAWPTGGWRDGTYAGEGYRQDGSGTRSFSGTWTVTRVVLRPDATPVELSALFAGTRSTPEGPVPVRLIVVLSSVPTGLPAYLITEPAVLTATLPAGSDQSLPVRLRNVGGAPATLDRVAVGSVHAVPAQPTVWSAGQACLGVAVPAGGTCTASVRAVQDTSRYPLAQATWTGPGGLLARVELRGDHVDPAVAPQVNPRVNSTWRGAVVLDLDSGDPQAGQRVQLRCRVDAGAFTACGPEFYVTGLTGGSHTLTVYGTDPDGHMSDWQRLTFTVPGATGRDLLTLTGNDSQAYSTSDVRLPLLPQGGRLIDAPVIAVAGSEVYTVGVGSDRNLYVRSRTLGWKALGPAGTRCTGPSIAVSGKTLAVACRGGNGHLYVGKAELTAGRLPFVSRFTDRGGALLYGTVTTTPGSGGFAYDVVGTDHAIWTTGDSGGWRKLPGGLRCYGPPASDSLNGNALGCRSSSGSLHLVLARGNPPVDVGGQIVGRPGIAVDLDGTTRSYVLGTNGRIYVAWTAPARVSTPFRPGPAGAGTYGLSSGWAPR